MTNRIEHVVEEIIEDVVEVIEDALSWHPHHPHFHLGKPRLASFVLLHKGKHHMSSTSPIYLSAATTAIVLQAVDQYGFNYVGGDLSSATATAADATVVSPALSAFDSTTGQATLTVTQGAPGETTVTVADGSVSLELAIVSYTPALAGFKVVSVTAEPAPAAAPAPEPVVEAAPEPAPEPAAEPAAAADAGVAAADGAVSTEAAATITNDATV